MKQYDAIVIGAGPAGTYTAKTLAENNHQVALYEQYSKIGEPMNCAGLVTPRVYEEFSIPTETSVQNHIYGAHIHSPNGKMLSIGGDKLHAYAINRTNFDKELASQAKQAGVYLFNDHKLVSAQRIDNRVECGFRTKKEVVLASAPLLIGADGPQSYVRQNFFLVQPKQILRGIGCELKDTNLDSKNVHIFLGNKIAPGFFAWLIPTHKKGKTARLGLCIPSTEQRSPKYYFDQLQKNPSVNNLIKHAEPTTYSAGLIPLKVFKYTTTDNVMIVGDAAAQVKPTSGGGVFTGLRCARHCARTAHKAIIKKKHDQQFLKTYHKEWTNDIGRELSMGMHFRSIYSRISDKDFDKYIEKLNTKKIVDTINANGDIDFPSKLLLPLMKKAPSLIKLAFHLTT